MDYATRAQIASIIMRLRRRGQVQRMNDYFILFQWSQRTSLKNMMIEQYK